MPPCALRSMGMATALPLSWHVLDMSACTVTFTVQGCLCPGQRIHAVGRSTLVSYLHPAHTRTPQPSTHADHEMSPRIRVLCFLIRGGTAQVAASCP
ncbi:hypothetical protein C8T65DRAFT_248096 [Cerioporus squamosus]|nr:hypothetical protein C8T65DRAFT_248096 [Cerioporus squamosus]